MQTHFDMNFDTVPGRDNRLLAFARNVGETCSKMSVNCDFCRLNRPNSTTSGPDDVPPPLSLVSTIPVGANGETVDTS